MNLIFFSVTATIAQAFQFLQCLFNACYFDFFFLNGHPNRCEVISHYSFIVLICISLMSSDVDHLFINLLFIHLLGKNVCSSPFSIFNWVISHCCLPSFHFILNDSIISFNADLESVNFLSLYLSGKICISSYTWGTSLILDHIHS